MSIRADINMPRRRVIPVIIAVLVAAGIACAGAVYDFWRPSVPPPRFAVVKAGYNRSEAVLLDRHGVPLQELRLDHRGRRLEWVALGDISPALIRAVLHGEDRRFYRHRGVDWLAVGGAVWNRLWGGPPRGASTITMQLARKLTAREERRSPPKTLGEKWRQMKAARRLETEWRKEEILEAYLNLITFRGELQGIAAAARGLFGKDPGGLNDTESLILAALIPSTNQSPERIVGRAGRIGGSLGIPVGTAELQSLVQERVGRPYRLPPRLSLAPHAARILLSQPGARVVSTLDRDLQEQVLGILNRRLAENRERNVNDGAVLVVENKSGEILAYVGNSGETASAPHVDGVPARRQAGSVLKPFLYELAIEKKILTAASLIDDSPLQIPTPTGLYIPENYGRDFQGPVTLRTALASSLNVPAVRTLMTLGADTLVMRLRDLGMDSVRKDGDYYGYSLALGSVDVSLRELVNAYRSLANGGRWSELALVPGAARRKSRQVMSREGAFVVSTILSDREGRTITFGWENFLSTRFWTAVKTGTSKDMRDNWCIGYSDTYTVGVWIGNFSGAPMWNVTGVTGAAPVWLDVMNHLHRHRPSVAPAPPPGVTSGYVHLREGRESPREEWFVSGTEPAAPGFARPRTVTYGEARIVYPVAGMIVTIDPDIPEDYQLIAFEASEPAAVSSWRLNRRLLPSASHPLLWKPSRGTHRLEMIDKEGVVIDSVTFTVR
jgi:penicillin-binding protein 1C